MDFGVGVPTDAVSLQLPSYLEEPYRDTKQNAFIRKDCLLHDAKDFFRNDEFYNSRVEHDAFKQGGTNPSIIFLVSRHVQYFKSLFLFSDKSSFLNHNFVADNCGSSWNNWSCDLDSSMMNHMRSRKYDRPDFSFEDIHMQKRRFIFN